MFGCRPIVEWATHIWDAHNASSVALETTRISMEETLADRKRRDEQVKERISQKLIQSGEKERLKELLRHKLTESGWRDEMKAYCKDVIRSKGIDQITVEDLIEEITPKGRASVPESVRAEMLEKIKSFIEKAA